MEAPLIRATLLVCVLLAFVMQGCASKKSAPIEPPEEPVTVHVEEPPAQPAPDPVPPPPPQPRRPAELNSPAVKPRAASSGDAASLKLVEGGIKQMNGGNLVEAEQLFEQALRISPSNGKPYYYLGVVAAKQKNYDRSLGFLAQAETYLSSDAFWMSQVLLQEGLVLKAQNKKNEARAKLQQAIQKDPKNSWAEAALRSLE